MATSRRAPTNLKGAHYSFDRITVTGTEDVLMAAVMAEGETVLENCAREPEVVDLASLLVKMGAGIEGAGTSTIRVQGVETLHGARHRIIPDRIEAATFILAGALTGGDLMLTDCDPSHLTSLLHKLEEVGVRVKVGEECVRVMGDAATAQGGRYLDRRVSGFPHRRAGAISWP